VIKEASDHLLIGLNCSSFHSKACFIWVDTVFIDPKPENKKLLQI